MNWPFSSDLFTLAEKTGISCICLAVLLAAAGFIQAAILPLFFFLLLCLLAPFCPGWSFYLPLLSRAQPGCPAVALTFDDGPSPLSTPLLLELLARYNMKATFFVIGRHAEQYPELIQAILRHGHSIGNHSYQHDYLIMLRSCQTLKRDILRTQQILESAGVQTLIFRPPVGITTPRLGPVLEELDLQAVTFSCRAYDRGNLDIRHLADRILKRLRPGDILLLHDNPPADEEMRRYWRTELERLFTALQHRGTIVPLERLAGRPVMIHRKAAQGSTQGAAVVHK